MARINFKQGFRYGPISVGMCFALMWLGGCSTTSAVPRRQNGVIVGTQGAGSEVVFPGVEVAALRDGQCSGAEFARRDASMSIEVDATVFENDAWPQVPQPSLDWARQLSLPTSPNTYMYNSRYQYQYRYHSGPSVYWYGY